MKINNKLLLLLLTISFTTIFYSCIEKRGELKRIWFKGSYNRDFNDLNDLHLSSALKIGIEPVSSREEAEHASRKMEEITIETDEIERDLREINKIENIKIIDQRKYGRASLIFIKEA